jgi:thiosulfate reductase cytochrome b subunit
MNPGTQRSILRWIHILFGLPLIGFVYGPAEEVAQYAPMFRYVFVPVLVLSGLWMWKGHLVTRLFRNNSL